MDKEIIKLAHESITSIVRSAIEKGNMTPVEIAELTQNLKNVFLPTVDERPISDYELDENYHDTSDSENSNQDTISYINASGIRVIARPMIKFKELRDERKQNKDFCKSGAVILDPENTYSKDYIICLEDLVHKKMLTSYLKRKFNLTPDEYRKKWGLPADYPMLTKSLIETRRANGEARKKLET